jgi:hypothetical protein
MIDFRYHLVSLVAVFLALAVGIVLGAGPLKEPISESLSQSVQQLRQDRDALGDQLKTAQAATRNRDTFIGDVQGQLVANQLSGRAVVLVTLPGADADAVRPLTQALTDAGARITGRIDVRDAWADPASRSARDTAIANLRSIAGGSAGTSGAGSSRTPSPSPTASGTTGSAADTAAAQVLARALVTSDSTPGERPDETSRTLLEGLGRAGLLDVNGEVPGRASEAVLLVPGVATAVEGVVPTPSPSPSPDETPAWVALASVLDADSAGAVVVGPASSATAGGLLAAVRARQPLATAVSTVDTGGTPMGDVTTVLALREQQLGSAGSYGFGAGAKAILPTRGSAG